MATVTAGAIRDAHKQGQLNALTREVGQHVRIQRDPEGTRRVRILAHGKLEAPDEDGEFFVRIGDDPQGHGINGIGFYLDNVSSVFRQSSNILDIILK